MARGWQKWMVGGVCAAVIGGAFFMPGAQIDVEAQAGLTPAPARRAGEGFGPFNRMVVQNVMVIDGTGAPPYGPVNITISNNRIASIGGGGGGGRQGGATQPDHVIDGTGMYVMPGFVDMHVHAGGAPKNAEAEYAYKLWLGHGVTTVRGVALGSQQFSVSERARSEKNEIVAPRIFNCQRPGGGCARTPTASTASSSARWSPRSWRRSSMRPTSSASAPPHTSSRAAWHR